MKPFKITIEVEADDEKGAAVAAADILRSWTGGAVEASSWIVVAEGPPLKEAA